MSSKSLFLDTLHTGRTTRPPVWFMRQAGRALASYRKLKERYSFIELLRDPKLAADVTLLPLEALNIDALILFSDILVIPEAMGVEVNYEQGSPKMLTPLHMTAGKLTGKPNPAVLDSVYKTIKEIKIREQNIPLIGFCGGPLTVFLYLYQGSGHGGNFDNALDFFYREPEATDKLLEEIIEMSIYYAKSQVDSGVDAFQIFETWANVIPAELYIERILPHVIRLADAINSRVPVLYFPRFFSNGYEALVPYLKHFSAISVDYLNHLPTLSEKLPIEIALQGNLDPTLVKYANISQLKSYIRKYLDSMASRKKWILNLGHGVLPGTPEENLKAIVDIVQESN